MKDGFDVFDDLREDPEEAESRDVMYDMAQRVDAIINLLCKKGIISEYELMRSMQEIAEKEEYETEVEEDNFQPAEKKED